MRILLTATVLANGCACGPSRPAKFFPIGLYNVSSPAVLLSLRHEGFNAVETYDRSPANLAALAMAAKKAGMKLLVQPQDLMTSTVSTRDFPLAAWYLVDEPDVSNMKPEALRALDTSVKEWSPKSPTAFVVGDGRKAPLYRDSGDVLMVDWYPVPHLPLESAGEHVRYTVEAAGSKPVWAVLQAMNWKDYSQRDPKKPRVGRFPDIGEIRFMTYHSILEGAQGIWYFEYGKPGGAVLSDIPEEWFALTTVVRELAAMRPIFARGRPIVLPIKLKEVGPMAKAWTYHGRDYVVVLNPRKDVMLPVPDELLEMRWRPLFEPRRYAKDLLTAKNGAYYLLPYRVMVFESRLNLKRIFSRTP